MKHSVARAARIAPTTPPAGPERIVRTGSFAAASAEMLPPEDCMTRKAEFCFFSFGFSVFFDERLLSIAAVLVSRLR